jgi:hypothetical protein
VVLKKKKEKRKRKVLLKAWMEREAQEDKVQNQTYESTRTKHGGVESNYFLPAGYAHPIQIRGPHQAYLRSKLARIVFSSTFAALN